MSRTMSWIAATLLLLLIGYESGFATASGHQESAETYDIGCYAERSRIVRTFGVVVAYTNSLLPTCMEGGLFRKFQCNLQGCYCVYADTGRNTGQYFYFAYHPFLTASRLTDYCNETTQHYVNECQAPPVNYPCDVGQVKYEYNANTQTCDPISFGCRGFKSLSECENACVPQIYDACSFPEDEGEQCEDFDEDVGPIPRFRHNERGECVPFSYLGCGGNSNNYATDWECLQACVDDVQEFIPILIRVNTRDRYSVIVPRWLTIKHRLHENRTNTVDQAVLVDIQEYAANITTVEETSVDRRRLVVGGRRPRPPPDLEREGNRKTREQIQRDMLIPLIVCTLPPKVGLCRGYFPRWYYDDKQSKCMKFVFGGCDPNGNNFRRSKDCTEYCDAPFTPSPLEEVSPPKDRSGRPIYNPRSLNTGSEIGDGEVIFQVGGPSTTTTSTTTATSAASSGGVMDAVGEAPAS